MQVIGPIVITERNFRNRCGEWGIRIDGDRMQTHHEGLVDGGRDETTQDPLRPPPRHRPQATTMAAGSAPGLRVPCRQDFQQAGPDSTAHGPGRAWLQCRRGRVFPVPRAGSGVRRPALCPGAAPPIRMAMALTEPAGGKVSPASQFLFALPAPGWGARGTSQRRVPAPTAALPPRPCHSSPPTIKVPDAPPPGKATPEFSLPSALPNCSSCARAAPQGQQPALPPRDSGYRSPTAGSGIGIATSWNGPSAG